MAPTEEQRSAPRIFISYSHDSAEHCDRVLMLAQQLRREGIDAELDQFHQDELKHWPRWCEEQLRPENSQWVLCICTPEYKRRVENRVAADVGKGVLWEGTLIYNYLYDEKGNSRCIPVLLGDSSGSDIPAILNGYTRFQITAFGLDDPQSGYAKLYRLLTGQSTAQKAGLGKLHKLPALSARERITDFTDLINQILAGVIAVKSDTTKILSILENRIPPPSTKAHPHNLPPWMSPAYFIGREKETRTLSEGLTASGNALAVVQPQVVYGEGGLGKTRLAIQVAWVLYLQHQCDMAFVISASSPPELDTQLAALDTPSLLDLYEGEQPPRELDVRKQNVIHVLRERVGHWILVLDAADSDKAREAVNGLLTQLAGGRFLITSRREDWPRTTVRKVPLSLFNIEEARACLTSRYWKPEPPAEEIGDFDRVATELGFLPLALALAASYMDSRRVTPARYASEWKEKHDTLLGFTAVDVEQGRSLLAAFKLSYDLVSPQAAHLLHMLAWLAAEPFPRRLVEDSEKMRKILSTAIEGSAGGDPTNALAELRTLSLLQLDDESLRLHALVLKCARATLPEGARADLCAIALEWLSSILPGTQYDEINWKLWDRLSPHLDEVIAAANELKIEGDALCEICVRLGVWLLYQARHNAAEPLMRRTLAIDEKSYGPDHHRVAIDLNNLAALLLDTNGFAEAEPLMRRALRIDEKNYGPDHPNVAIELNNLAQLLKDTNRLAEAEPLMRRALGIDEKSYGPNHPNVAIGINNLAQLLQVTNRLTEAEPLMKRAVEIFEKSLGKDHPNVAGALSTLAQLLKDTNRLAEAEPLMQRALGIDQKSYGPEHPTVATRLNNLAELLQATNRLAEAEPLILRALAITEKSYEPEHPNVARALNHLTHFLQATNRLVEAEPLILRALAIDEKSYGPEHPKVATDLNNLAVLLQDTNRLAEAEPLMRRALTIDEKSFGPEHPKVATGLNNLAQLLQATNRLAEAEQLMRRTVLAFVKFKQSTGHLHPHLKIAFRNYRGVLEEMLLDKHEIARRIAEIGKEAGLDENSYSALLAELSK